jgi:glycosyltransferase involved in cell wall biosynthesis
MISVLILTHNEELNLARCLDSVKWSDDVLVLDSFSTDRTVEIAKSNGARLLQNRFINFADQRNFGSAHGDFKYDWILHLDADEVVTPGLQQEIQAVVQRKEKDAYRVASKMMFHGGWLKHSGLYPWYQVRLGRRNLLGFVQVGHGQRESLPANQIGTLKEPLIHFSFSKGIRDWLQRHNHYSTAEAEYFCSHAGNEEIEYTAVFSLADGARRKRALKQLFGYLPFRPTLRFLYMYLYRLGFLDGHAGFTYCRILAIYEYFIILKVREIRRRKRGLPM